MVEVNSFYKYLISKGYYFDKELIENYLLSLKVKPFVLLTGNSGTGKTKLSQLFAKFLRNPNYDWIKVTTKATSWGYSEKKGTGGNPCGWTIIPDYVDEIIPYDMKKEYEIEVGGHSTVAEIRVVPQLGYDKNNEEMKEYFKELYWQEKEQIKIDKSNGVPHVDQLVDLGISCDSLHSILFNDYVESCDFTIKMNNIKSFLSKGDVILSYNIYKYCPIKEVVDCRILSSSNICATAKFHLKFRMSNYMTDEIKEYLENLLKEKKSSFDLRIKNFVPIENFKFNFNNKNYKIVPVGANWTDNSNIVGYHNIITDEYQSTPAFDLIKNSKRDLENPYFLVLDEMNLSHVERYFSDFLSAIESGEKIPLYGSNDSLKLPNNLFIVGTVNIDETTYMFSPKVLDRANTIEFDTLSPEKYIFSNFDETDFEGDIEFLQNPLSSNVSDYTIEDLKRELSKIQCSEGNLLNVLVDELTEFQKILKKYGFDFGFRVINEILIFMLVAWRYENSPQQWNLWERYFDAQIKQKILPKLHGSEKAIGNILTNLFNLCLVERDNNENPRNFKINKEDCRYYTSAVKLQNMSKVLVNQRYVSFIN